MEPIDARAMISAAATPSATTPTGVPVERRRRLSAPALAITNEKVRPAYSPVVITGLARIADFVLISLTGIVLYFGYVARNDGATWP